MPVRLPVLLVLLLLVPATGSAEEVSAARQLVEGLYAGLLRREPVGTVDEDLVEIVRTRGVAGLAEVGGLLVASKEFRDEVPKRAEEVHGRTASRAELRERILADAYRHLYGYAEPPRGEREKDLEDLEICLSGSVGSKIACTGLGRSLVARPLYTDGHWEWIEALPPPRR